MIDSSFLSIETPVKVFIRRKEEITPAKCVNLSKRFSPSLTLRKQLAQIERVHNFQFHDSVQFVPLSEIGISKKLLNALSTFFKNSVDIPDTVKKHEEVAIDSKYFNSVIRDYIGEEFNCQIEYSFCIVSVLLYIHRYGVSLEEALCELFRFSTSLSLCDQCVTGDDTIDKRKVADIHNFLLLKSLMKEPEVSDVCASEDSRDDPTCNIKDFLSSPSEDTDSCGFDKKEFNGGDSSSIEDDFSFNPFVETNEVQEVLTSTPISFNPFVENNSPQEVLKTPSYRFNPLEENIHAQEVLNSTISFNPFVESDNNFKEFEELRDSSFVRPVKERKYINCDYCGKMFPNSNNMKLHLIRYISQIIKFY